MDSTIPIPIRGMALQPHRPRPLSGSKGHPQKDSYYLETSVLWESMWFQDESHKILYWVSFYLLISDSHTFDTFKRRLKTYLFK